MTTPAPHASSPSSVLASLDATDAGLASDRAESRLAEHGPNQLPPPPRKPAIVRFLAHFNDVLIYILIGAAVLKALMGDWVDFAVVLGVAVINAVIGFVQEGQAERALDGIRTMLSTEAQVLRDGEWRAVPAETVVPGDVVRVRAGDRVPADLRLLECTNLQVDEAALTGESVAAIKDAAAVAADAGIGDRTSMLFSSTIVATGSGVGVVIATGTATEIGRIQQMVTSAETMETPLSQQLDRFGKQLSVGILGMAVVMVLVGLLVHDFDLNELISATIGFAVAAIPEGLPAVVTITLALGVAQMARRQAIARKLTAVEALGSVTTICSDKTGTLTQNEMTVRSVVTRGGEYAVEGTGYAPHGRVLVDDAHVALADRGDLAALVSAASSCNDARVVEEDGRWRVVGQPTEGAIATLALKLDVPAGATRLAEVPFDSAHKFMATLDDLAEGGIVLRAMGAPDRLLDRCTHQRGADGALEPLDTALWTAEIERLAARGLRTLAAAESAVAGDAPDAITVDDVDGLVFLGLFGIVDPPRPEAIDAIAECHAAGIRVKMITGDHAGTATAIARELGIAPGEGEVRHLTGAELEVMSQDELEASVRDVDIYARTSPEHKIRIVRALQAHREVVAMTGDGVNDAPALRRADVGVAMGIKGTEATKEAADIVLADDNFATIERAVEEGRRIYDNIRKSVVFLLPTNGAQSLVMLVAVLLGLTLPLAPVQILWVNLVCGTTLSLALAYEKAEPGLMRRPPRGSGGAVLSRSSLNQVIVASLVIGGATLGVHAVARAMDVDTAVAQTLTVAVLVLAQVAYLFNCRFMNASSLTPRAFTGSAAVWIAIGALMAFQLIFTYVPWMHTVFESAPLTWAHWGIALGVGVAVFLLVEGYKALIRARATR